MDLQPERTPEKTPETLEFAEPPEGKPLELLANPPVSLPLKPLENLLPVITPDIFEEATSVEEMSLKEVAKIARKDVTDAELKPARIKIGLGFVGFSALLLMSLLLYSNTLHPELIGIERVREYWYQYIFFVSLGVAGMMMLGREAMRSPQTLETNSQNLEES